MLSNERISVNRISGLTPIFLPNERSPFAFPPAATTAPTPQVGSSRRAPTIRDTRLPQRQQAPDGTTAERSRFSTSDIRTEQQRITRPQDQQKSLLPGQQELSEREKREVQRLQQIDRKVRAHEAAHQAAAGSLVRGKTLRYQRGPDGRQYAVAGEVRIDISPVPGDPAATIRKMQQVQRASLAPADPSPQDRSVAAHARRQEMRARQEVAKQRQQEQANASDFQPFATRRSKAIQRAARSPFQAQRAQQAYQRGSTIASFPPERRPTPMAPFSTPSASQSARNQPTSPVPTTAPAPFFPAQPQPSTLVPSSTAPSLRPPLPRFPGATGTIFDSYF